MVEVREPTTGFYGKVPAVGDFVRRRLPQSMVEPWDAWLREGIVESRQRLDDRWLDLYLRAPIWRFALSPGLAGDTAAAGILMPSVDAANRHFPLTIATVMPNPAPNPFAILRTGGDWFEAAEALALSSLDEHGKLDDLEAGLDQLSWPVADSGLAELPLPLRRDGRMLWNAPIDALNAPDSAVLADLMHGACRDRFGDYALFWSAGSDEVEPGLNAGSGLPREAAFIALLDDAAAALFPEDEAAPGIEPVLAGQVDWDTDQR